MRVTLEDVSLVYDQRDLYAGLTATFEAHQLNAVVGPSGSGKSSLLSLVAGSIGPSSGAVHLHDSGATLHADESRCVWVPQALNAIGSRTVLDNVMIAPLSDGMLPAVALERSITSIDEVGLAGKAHRPARTLSGGELQRVSIARALASQRPLVLADEPTANLDAANTLHIASLLRRISTTKTVIVATHDEAIFDLADFVLRLR